MQCTSNVHSLYMQCTFNVRKTCGQSTSLRRQNAVKGSKNEPSHYNTRQEKTRQDKTRQEKTRQGKRRKDRENERECEKKPDGRVRG